MRSPPPSTCRGKAPCPSSMTGDRDSWIPPAGQALRGPCLDVSRRKPRSQWRASTAQPHGTLAERWQALQPGPRSVWSVSLGPWDRGEAASPAAQSPCVESKKVEVAQGWNASHETPATVGTWRGPTAKTSVIEIHADHGPDRLSYSHPCTLTLAPASSWGCPARHGDRRHHATRRCLGCCSHSCPQARQ